MTNPAAAVGAAYTGMFVEFTRRVDGLPTTHLRLDCIEALEPSSSGTWVHMSGGGSYAVDGTPADVMEKMRHAMLSAIGEAVRS